MLSSACLGSKTVYWATLYAQTLFIPVKLKYSFWHVPTPVWISTFLSGSKASAPGQPLMQKPCLTSFNALYWLVPHMLAILNLLNSDTLSPAWTPPSLPCSGSIILHHPPPLADVLLTPLRPLHSALDPPFPPRRRQLHLSWALTSHSETSQLLPLL